MWRTQTASESAEPSLSAVLFYALFFEQDMVAALTAVADPDRLPPRRPWGETDVLPASPLFTFFFLSIPF